MRFDAFWREFYERATLVWAYSSGEPLIGGNRFLSLLNDHGNDCVSDESASGGNSQSRDVPFFLWGRHGQLFRGLFSYLWGHYYQYSVGSAIIGHRARERSTSFFCYFPLGGQHVVSDTSPGGP